MQQQATPINFFGITNFRNIQRKFGIKLDDRRRHFYAIGKTGMGKTEMLKNMAVQDIKSGYGMGFVDPHGEAVEDLLDFVPKERVKDVVYFNPADTRFPLAFNVMEQVDPEKRHMVASGLMSVFKKIWPDVWSARMEYILNNVILALLEYPGSTLLGINRMLSDSDYRAEVIEKVHDPVVKTFWLQEYSRYTQRYEVEATAAIQNKVGQFISNPLIRNIVGQTHSSVDMRELMDSKKILLVNISKGRIGEDNSRLLGGLLITKLQLAAMSRVDIPEEARNDFFLYIDEFQNFATESFVNILSEARKYRLCLILSHQYITQLDETVEDAVFGNVGTLVTFRVGAEDAEVFEKEFSPEFVQADFVNLGKYTIYVKLMIDGIAGRPFSAQTLPPPPRQPESCRSEIIEFSRDTYGTTQQEVEDRITKWSGVEELAGAPPPPPPAQPQVLYDARCSNCGKDTKVVFPPDGKRPVYCKSCRKKLQQQRPAPPQPVPQPSLPPQVQTVEEAPEKGESVSLEELKSREPNPLYAQKKQPPRARAPQERKAVEREGLQAALRQALDKVQTKPQAAKAAKEQTSQKGVLEPGQTIYFDQ
ncbi:MAG TPA: type IV secretion system DNA-binding domain-containing protein [Candidatus Paceibacterota bacterium]|nr:type IV secretion system DNA-binding domain-containing protein [Candidatus Paceibacterota bacterium]